MTRIGSDWGAFAERHVTSVFEAARRVVRDEDAAWDCVQEAFLTALSSRAPTDLADPLGWLCGVARNHARHAVRGRGRFRRFLERLVLKRPVLADGVPPDGREALNLALSRLPARLRDAVVLRYLARMSVAEVAKAQGISETAAKSRVHRGLGRLRSMLGGSLAVVLLARAASAGWSGPLSSLVTAAKAAAPAALPAIAAVSLPKVGALVGVPLLLVVGTLTLGSREPERGPVRADLGPAIELPAPPPVDLPAPADQPEAPPAEAAPPPEPALPRGPTRIVVRDLADGGFVSGLTFDIPRYGISLTTDAAGRLSIPEGKAAELEMKDPEWTALEQPLAEILETGEMWLYRKIRVVGDVRADPWVRRSHPPGWRQTDLTDVQLTAG
ncbi:MAG: RNA polymerase sigma factor, partial [Planctomycetota bacterium]